MRLRNQEQTYTSDISTRAGDLSWREEGTFRKGKTEPLKIETYEKTSAVHIAHIFFNTAFFSV